MDKYRALRNAERLVIERKFSQAIQEYERLLQKEPEDPALLNTIGDLFVRARNNPQALKNFQKVAEIYLGSGFVLRAIATYKKIHHLEPRNLEVNQKLAELFEKQGLNQDANRHIAILVQRHRERDERGNALKWMRKAILLNPEDVEAHLRLADFVNEEDRGASTEHYLEAAQILANQKHFQQAEEVCRTAFEKADYDSGLCRLFADSAEKLSRLEEAEQFLTKRLEQGSEELPYQLALAMVKEKMGDPHEASQIYSRLRKKGHVDAAVSEGLDRTARESVSEPADAFDSTAAPQKASDEKAVAEPVLAGSEQAAEEQSEEDSEAALGVPEVAESPFHPAGTIEEIDLPDLEPSGSGATDSSGLFLDEFDMDPASDGASPAASDEGPTEGAETSGLFEIEVAEEEPSPPEEIAFEDESPSEAFRVADGTELESVEPSAVDDLEETAEEPFEVAEELTVDSLEDALEEADFYTKLGFQEEAVRIIRALAHEFPEDERVVRRAKKVLGVIPKPKKKAPSEAEFDQAIEEALDSLFEGPEMDDEIDEVLRYDVQKSSETQGESPKIHYDLGLAYKEMGLLQDAVQEFLAAVELLNEPHHLPQKILCCSTLANSYLQLHRHDDAIHWAKQGLEIEDMKDFEWKALQYDLGCALEEKGERQEARQVFQNIAEREKSYRDVERRIKQLVE